MRIGTRIRIAREKLGITQAALAQACMMRVEFLQDIEAGRVQKLHWFTIRKISDHLGLPLDFLLRGDKSELPTGSVHKQPWLMRVAKTIFVSTIVLSLFILLCALLRLLVMIALAL